MDLSFSCGMSTFTFVVLKCCFSRKELTRNPMRENAESNVQNTWNDPMWSLSQKWCDRNTEREPHPLKTEQYQLRFALSLEDNARSAKRARWFKSIIVRKPSYKQRQKTNWIDGCIQWNQMLRNESVKRGPYFIKALWSDKTVHGDFKLFSEVIKFHRIQNNLSNLVNSMGLRSMYHMACVQWLDYHTLHPS